MCVFAPRPVKLPTSPLNTVRPPKWLFIFLWKETHSETKSMEIVEDFLEQKLEQQRQTLEIVEDFACEDNISSFFHCSSFFFFISFLHFSLFSNCFAFFVHFLHFSSCFFMFHHFSFLNSSFMVLHFSSVFIIFYEFSLFFFICLNVSSCIAYFFIFPIFLCFS